MVRSKYSPEFDKDFAVIVWMRYSHEHLLWQYKTHNIENSGMAYREESLRPIPKEKPNGIDALEFIKDLAGVSA